MISPPIKNRFVPIIAELNNCLSNGNIIEATRIIESFEASMLVRTLQLIKERAPEVSSKFLRNIIRHSKRPDLVLNTFQFLKDREEISPTENIELSSYLDTFALGTLFGDDIGSYFQDELFANGSSYKFYSDIDQLSSRTTIEYVYIDSITFKSPNKKQIHFEGTIEFELQLEFDRETMGNRLNFPGNFKGYFDCHGIYLTDITIDTSSFYV